MPAVIGPPITLVCASRRTLDEDRFIKSCRCNSIHEAPVIRDMMRWINPKTGIAVGAFSLLSVVAAMGWNRASSPSAIVDPQAFAQPATLANDGHSAYVQNASYSNGYNSYYDQSAPVYRQRSHRRHHRSRYVSNSRRYYPQAYATRSYVRPRSGKKSVAIVAGTAGVGAAIGALAGGGRGAGIGALSGAGAGFLYDRLTHRHPPQF